MYKLVAIVTFIVVAQKLTDADLYHIPPEVKPSQFAHLEGCYVRQLNRVLSYNVPYSPQDGNSCTQYRCGNDNYTTVEQCGTFNERVEPNCVVLKGDLTLPYPACCYPRIKCNNVNEKPAVKH